MKYVYVIFKNLIFTNINIILKPICYYSKGIMNIYINFFESLKNEMFIFMNPEYESNFCPNTMYYSTR